MSNIPVKILDDIADAIHERDNIYIASHIQPDGDNIGSILAMGLALLELNKNVFVLKSDIIPSDYLFLPGIEIIKEYKEITDLDLFIILDCSDIDRLGINKNLINKANFVINIDHHVTNTNFGDLNFVDSKAAATGELVFRIIEKLNIKFTKEIATNLYTAISTDTGSFKYESVTDKTHEIIAKLLRCGIDHSYINNKLYHSRSLERTNLLIESFLTLNTLADNKAAIVKVTQKMLNRTKTKMEDTEGIISFVRDIDSVEVACLLKEIDDKETKVSLRSKSYIDVAKICEPFNGGGHIRAAGCTIYEDIGTSEKLISNILTEVFR